jgi:hypothetical protein
LPCLPQATFEMIKADGTPSGGALARGWTTSRGWRTSSKN